jgi:hypothetical protein
MSPVGIPGFTADASLFKTRVQYRTGYGRAESGGVRPQFTPLCGGPGDFCSLRYPCCRGACIDGQCSCLSNNDCATGWCNRDGQCDCFGVGDPCRFGPQSCCSGKCGGDATCVDPVIQAEWVPLGLGGLWGLVEVRGSNFTSNWTIAVSVDGCGVSVTETDANGSFLAILSCNCGSPSTVVANEAGGPRAITTVARPC